MKTRKGNALSITIGVLGAAVAIVPLTIYYAVETASMHMSMEAMTCFAACVTATVIGAAIAAVAAASVFIKSTKLGLGSAAVLFAGGVAAIVAPRAIGFCAHANMACRYLTAPTLTLLGAAIAVLAAAKLVGGIAALRNASAV